MVVLLGRKQRLTKCSISMYGPVVTMFQDNSVSLTMEGCAFSQSATLPFPS